MDQDERQNLFFKIRQNPKLRQYLMQIRQDGGFMDWICRKEGIYGKPTKFLLLFCNYIETWCESDPGEPYVCIAKEGLEVEEGDEFLVNRGKIKVKFVIEDQKDPIERALLEQHFEVAEYKRNKNLNYLTNLNYAPQIGVV